MVPSVTPRSIERVSAACCQPDRRASRRHRRHRSRHPGLVPPGPRRRPERGHAARRGQAAPHRGGPDGDAVGHRAPGRRRAARRGYGLSGGATALDGGIVLSTERMRDITVDPVTRTAVTQPGLFNAEVKKAVAAYGLWYPPDPSSFEICSIGGNVATNAGGLCCVKYGVTTDYVLGLQVVLADGTAVRLGGPRLKDVAGLSLTKLFVGSEGTLGVVTEVTLKLLPAAPGLHRRRVVRLGVGGRRRGRASPANPAVDARVHGRRRHQRRRGQAEDRPRPQRRSDDGRRVRRPRARGRRGHRVHGAGVHRTGATEVFSTETPRRARRSWPRAGSRSPRWRPRAAASRGRRRAVAALADLVSGVEKIAAQHGLMISVIATPVTATPTR